MKITLSAILLTCFLMGNAQAPFYQVNSGLNAVGNSMISDILPEKKITLITGHYNLSAYHSAFSYGDFIKSENNSALEIDAKNAFSQLDANNDLWLDTEFKTLGIGFRLGKLGVGFQHSLTAFNVLNYPKDLFGLLFLGNSQYIDKEVQVGPQFTGMAYNSFGFGLGYDFGKLKLTGRFNWLSAAAGAQTKNNDVLLYTNPEFYQLRLTTNYELNSSNLINPDSLGESNFISRLSFDGLFKSNTGYSLDFAANYNLNNKTSIGGSIRGLGQINFNTNAKNYRSNKIINYDGIDIGNFITGDSLSLASTIDSLGDLLKFDESNRNFSIRLPFHANFHAQYAISSKLIGMAGMQYSSINDASFTSFTAGISFQPIKAIRLATNYTYIPSAPANIGLHCSFRFWLIELAGGTDNVLAGFDPKSTKYGTGYLGLRWIL